LKKLREPSAEPLKESESTKLHSQRLTALELDPSTQVVISSILNDTPATSFEVFINGQATSASACSLLVLGWDYLYHNGYYTYPIVGDTVYLQSRGGNVFVGGSLWYKTNNNQSCQISNDGVVLAVFNCGSTPPTPPVPPAGGYYQATLVTARTVQFSMMR
jgi:hypothetical protein